MFDKYLYLINMFLILSSSCCIPNYLSISFISENICNRIILAEKKVFFRKQST